MSPNLPHADRWAPPPVRNLILGRLRPIEVRRLEPHLELVRLQAGQVLAEPGTALQRVWFPATCVLSLYVLMGGGDTATVGLIGREGTAGYAAAFGGRRSHARLVVQVPGDALVLPARVVLATLASSATFRQSMLQYAEALHAQALQLAACSALHGAEERLASLLLSLDDRIEPGIVLPLTQELLAGMLGLQRTTVTAGAKALQRRGLISYSRGSIEILDRAGLEAAACECYFVSRLARERPTT